MGETSGMSEPERKSTFDERRIAAWISKAVVVTGHVVCFEDLTIDGRVEGTIELGNHSLTIGVGAGVKANLVAKNVTISGTVTGNILATEKVDLLATGSVEGDVTTPVFRMADGAVLTGRVEAQGTDKVKAPAPHVPAPATAPAPAATG
jgi:cytoskeletal protein CcmA (bactofilin family)